MGDDLALNAQQVTGVTAHRELPVVWAVAKGSFVNKAILVPAALAISAFAPWLVTPLLMVGGAFLCFEGAEKLLHRFLHRSADDAAAHGDRVKALASPQVDPVAFENARIKGAVRTDFILSAEIIAITLGTVADQSLPIQVGVMTGIAIAMTVGVYGLVAGIVKLDDAGLALSRRASVLVSGFGRLLLAGAPWLMRGLSVAGTAAMFLVGGGILVHGLPWLHHSVEEVAHGRFAGLTSALLNAAVGLLAGAVIAALVLAGKRLRGASPATS